MKALYFTILILSTSILTSIAQNSKKEEQNREKEEQYQLVLKMVSSGQYEFVGRKANTQKGRQIDLTTNGNFLRINGETATADIPYFGRAYSAGYSSSDGGIKFDGTMEEYDAQQNDKKHRILVKFKVKGADDTFDCSLTIYGPQSATLYVASNKKQGISYNGIINELKKE